MLIFKMINGQRVLQAPEEAEDGAAAGGPTGEDAGSESESEFDEMHEQFESSSYDDEVEEGTDDVEAEAPAEEEGSTEDGAESDSEEEAEADAESEADEDGQEEDKQEEAEEEGEEETEQQPEPLTQEQIDEARNQYIEKMSEQFQISDEDADLLRTEPEKVMPRLMAKAMTQAMEQSVAFMRGNLPKMVDTQLTQQTVAKETESKFFGKYPELNSKKAMKVAEGMAKAYRQANPEADLDEVMDNVAFMTWKKLGLPMDKLSERMEGTSSEEFKPSQTQRTKKDAFTPANAGKTGASSTDARQQKATSEFEEIALLMQNDTMFDDT